MNREIINYKGKRWTEYKERKSRFKSFHFSFTFGFLLAMIYSEIHGWWGFTLVIPVVLLLLLAEYIYNKEIQFAKVKEDVK